MRAFRTEVLAILRERYPDRTFEPGREEDIVRSGSMRLALGNLAAHASDPDPHRRRETIIAWFEQVAALGEEKPRDAAQRPWEDIRPQLRPKLVPRGYVDDSPSLVHRPFSHELRLAYAIDEGTRDRFVLAPMMEGWGASPVAVHDEAITNLEARSASVKLKVKPHASGRGVYLSVSEGDAYDAARIALPRFRGRILAALGAEARVGLPNRDFLVAWSRDFAAENRFVAQVRLDFGRQPYPLTDQIFVIEESGIRPL